MKFATFPQDSRPHHPEFHLRENFLSRRLGPGLMAACLTTLLIAGPAGAQTGMTTPPMGPANIVIPEKTIEDHIELPKASWKLNKIHKHHKKHKTMTTQTRKHAIKKLKKQERQLMRLEEALARSAKKETNPSDDRVKVMLVLENRGMVTAVQESIETLGGEVTAHFRKWVTALIPAGALKELNEVPGIEWIDEPPSVGPVDAFQAASSNGSINQAQCQHYVSQGVQASGADKWHREGYTGKGVKVAVLDSFGLADFVKNCGELPSVSVYPFLRPDGQILDLSSPHGTAVAEIIHDMAPEAELTFASPGDNPVAMAQYIVDLAQTGHKVISSSIGTVHFGPGDGTGSLDGDMFHQAVQEAKDLGAVYVQAAGNQAQFHWDGVFRDSNGDRFHEWSSDGQVVNFLNRLQPLSAGQQINIYLRWNAWPVTDQDYDMYLVYWNGVQWIVPNPVTLTNGQTLFPRSLNSQRGFQPPTEAIHYIAPTAGYYGIVVKLVSGKGENIIDLNGFNLPSLSYNVRERSLIDVATPDAAFSVAAVDAGTFNQEPYSSEGPLHGPGGLNFGGRATQPRISGFANVDTLAGYVGFGGPFNGTSAATPHVSGAAALVLSALPNSTPEQVKAFLETHALDSGEPGYDMKFGNGILSMGEPPVTPPPAPGLITPEGTIADTTPTYSWSASPRATFYYLYIQDSTGSAIAGRISAANSGCGSGQSTCSVTLSSPLAPGDGMWAAWGWNQAGYGARSAIENFTVMP